MANVVWKYRIPGDGSNPITVPKGAEILSCGLDVEGYMAVWALVNPKQEEKHLIIIDVRMTGTELVDDRFLNDRFIGTVMHDELIYHFFERR